MRGTLQNAIFLVMLNGYLELRYMRMPPSCNRSRTNIGVVDRRKSGGHEKEEKRKELENVREFSLLWVVLH